MCYRRFFDLLSLLIFEVIDIPFIRVFNSLSLFTNSSNGTLFCHWLYILPQSYCIFVKVVHRQTTLFPANQIFNDETSDIMRLHNKGVP